jgi:hypothetical protein
VAPVEVITREEIERIGQPTVASAAQPADERGQLQQQLLHPRLQRQFAALLGPSA